MRRQVPVDGRAATEGPRLRTRGQPRSERPGTPELPEPGQRPPVPPEPGWGRPAGSGQVTVLAGWTAVSLAATLLDCAVFRLEPCLQSSGNGRPDQGLSACPR